MEIFVNGEARQVTPSISVAQLLERLDFGSRRVAVELNRHIVPRSAYAAQTLKPGDRIEIVHAIGGG